MAQGKKSFVLYADYIDVFEQLSNEDAGQLIKHMFNYVNDKDPTTDNKLVSLSFALIKSQLKRDLKKWDEIKLKRSESGKKGGLAKQANARSAKQNLANQAVTVNDTVNVTVTSSIPPTIEDVISHIEEKTKLHFKDKRVKKHAEYFYNFYDSKGWKVGKNKMANWKSACTKSLSWDNAPIKEKLNNNGYANTHIDTNSMFGEVPKN